MNPKYAKGLPPQLRQTAYKICKVGCIGDVEPSLSQPSAYKIKHRQPQTMRASDFKNYSEGITIY